MASQSYNQQEDGHEPINGFIHLSQVALVMVPFPLQGHLNLMLHLSCLLTSYDEKFSLHFVGSASHNRQAKVRLHGSNPKTLAKIHFHDFDLPPFTCPPPDPASRVKFPGHLQPLFHGCTHLREPISQLLQELSNEFRRVVVIHDTLMASVVQDVKYISNAESFALQSVSAFTVFLHVWDSMREKPFELGHELIPKNVPSCEGCFTPEFASYIAKEYKVLDFESGRIFNTCRLLEEKYIKLLEKIPMNANKKLFAIGPFNPVDQVSNTIQELFNSRRRHGCLEWLEKQERDSVIFVSFGTTTTMTEEQMEELAKGLDRSGQKFIWVLRDADQAEVFEEGKAGRSHELPKGFEERVRERGMVVRDWAPQLEILAHPSTGGFMSHCGWNSCIESISMGVPIAAWPMHSDQPRNAVLVTRVLRIGIEVRDWEEREKVVMGARVEDAVRRLLASEEGEEIRKRAKEIGRAVKNAVAQGGASRLEMDSFVHHITRS